MDATEAIAKRRSIKEFSTEPVDRETLESLLELAVLAPNHRMTEPSRFVVLGREARRGLGEVLADRRARGVDDPEAARAIRAKAVESTEALPVAVVFTQHLDEDPSVCEEDYATVYMGIQNFLLGATAIGLGTHVKTGPAFDSAEARAVFGVPPAERVVAVVHVGWPASHPEPKPRVPATDVTRWLP